MDTESGLYYLQARYYDPEIGQFTSVDPLGLAGSGCGWNPVCYATAGVNETISLNSDALGFAEQAGTDIAHAVCEVVNWTVQNRLALIGIGLGIVAAGTGVGAIFEGATIAGFLLSATATTTGAAAAMIDYSSCVRGDSLACIGVVTGGTAAAISVIPVAGSALVGGGVIASDSMIAAFMMGFPSGVGVVAGPGVIAIDILEATLRHEK